MSIYRETLEESGYHLVKKLGKGGYILTEDFNKYELWFHNQNHASYGIILPDGKHLEFCRSCKEDGSYL